MKNEITILCILASVGLIIFLTMLTLPVRPRVGNIQNPSPSVEMPTPHYPYGTGQTGDK